MPKSAKAFGFRGLCPLTRGSAPGPRWGHCLQTPVIGSRYRARHVSEPSHFSLRSDAYDWTSDSVWTLETETSSPLSPLSQMPQSSNDYRYYCRRDIQGGPKNFRCNDSLLSTNFNNFWHMYASKFVTGWVRGEGSEPLPKRQCRCPV